MFGFEMRVEFSEIGCEMWKVSVDDVFVFIGVVSSHFLMHFEGTGISGSWIVENLPR